MPTMQKWGTNSHFTFSGTTAYTLAQSISIKTEHLQNRSSYLAIPMAERSR